MKALNIVAVGVCGVLYATIGYLTYLGIFCPVIGVVRFWPSVVIPAVFSVLFGPVVGGLGASIGIFISDMLIHGNALLSLLVGVPANFACFYIIGRLSRKKRDWKQTRMHITIGFILLALAMYVAYLHGQLSLDVMRVFLVVFALTYALVMFIGHRWARWGSFEVASLLGLAIGSLIIGVGVWSFSQFFILPTGERYLPLYASLLWFLWTFFTEIPFLVVLGPPILEACYKAFPTLRWERK